MNAKVFLTGMIGIFFSLSVNAQQLLSVDFESDVVGTNPASADGISGTVTVIDSTANKAGTGNGVEFTDDVADGGSRIFYDFAPGDGVPAVRIDMDIARLTEGTSGAFPIGVFQKGINSGSYKDRYATVNIFYNGDIQYQGGTTVRTDAGALTLNTKYTLTMFVNDAQDPVIDYLGTNDLAPDTVAFWLDGVYMATDSLRTRTDVTPPLEPASTTAALGRVGIATLSSAIPGSIALDNIIVTSLDVPPQPEPPSFPSDTPEDFEVYREGSSPLATKVVQAGTEDSFVRVVSSTVNTAGSGNGVQLKDYDAAAGTALEYEFGSNSAVKVSFDFSPVEVGFSADESFTFGIGREGVYMSSHTKRYAQFVMYKDGSLRAYWNGGDYNALGFVSAGSSNNVTMYANDFDIQSVDYEEGGNTYTLPPNSVAWWFNGVLQLNGVHPYGALDLDEVTADGTVGNTEGNLARIGLYSTTSSKEMNYVFDNILITTNLTGGVVEEKAYESWLADYPGLGSKTNLLDDAEDVPDGMNNLLEFALGGDPIVSDAAAVLPTYAIGTAEGSNWLYYVYSRRVDAATNGLTYSVVSGSDLTGAMDTPAEEAGSGPGASGFEIVTNRISMDAASQGFMKLQVELSE